MTVGDAATISGGDNASGNVTFTLYKDASCTQTEGVSGSGAIAGGTSASYSTTHTFAAPGTYYWQASYGSDARSVGYTTGCGDADEQIVIGKASPSATTQASPTTGTVVVPMKVGIGATMANGDNASGNVTFTLYKDASCTQTEGVSGSGAIAGGTSASYSTTHTFAAPGTYYWQASY